jgi:hypothetical protein
MLHAAPLIRVRAAFGADFRVIRVVEPVVRMPFDPRLELVIEALQQPHIFHVVSEH